ncbi:hypothetical protein O181_073948 [Austropuccinia psidii MF-1]|uniref:Uncharacterized protein n=1 Tax=Austropuccinia psidii MF-1 TaxID=1389203 RepID=A0A9Q3IAJ2_9BASI|nr:hypothetical protein [Austropuccinia psidii MF-1]
MTSMAPIQHINPLLLITDTLTESNTSAPNSDMPNLTSSDSAIGQRARSHVRKSGLYQTMVSDNESSEEYDIGDEDYVVAEDDGLGMDDVTPPKQARSLAKRRRFMIILSITGNNVTLMSQMQRKFTGINITWDREQRFHQCACHVLNLVAKDFLLYMGQLTNEDYDFFDDYLAVTKNSIEDSDNNVGLKDDQGRH